jgi:hypothetical protein
VHARVFGSLIEDAVSQRGTSTSVDVAPLLLNTRALEILRWLQSAGPHWRSKLYFTACLNHRHSITLGSDLGNKKALRFLANEIERLGWTRAIALRPVLTVRASLRVSRTLFLLFNIDACVL